MTQPSARLGDVLREAREARQVDLARVERDTKIRLRYLTALEGGDYRDLPGAVYVRGFLRNYGHYLGLDPEYLISLYRVESGAVQEERASVLPRPTTVRPRTFIITPGALVTAILTLFVVVFVAYLGYQFLTFARTPQLNITDPSRDLSAYTETQYTIRGVTEPNSRIAVDGLRENPEAEADADGAFSITVNLVPGVNVITITASDPRTGRDSEPVQRTINVTGTAQPSGTPSVATFTVSEPADGASAAGPVAVAGETSASGVMISATFVAPPELTFRVTDASGAAVAVRPAEPSAPDPVELTADGGAYTGELMLEPGTWDLTVAPIDDGGTGSLPAETRRVTVTASTDLTVRLEVRGGPSWFELYEDGVMESAASMRNAPDGTNIELSAQRTIRVRAGSGGAVRIVVNGVRIGTMGAVEEVVDWTVTAGS